MDVLDGAEVVHLVLEVLDRRVVEITQDVVTVNLVLHLGPEFQDIVRETDQDDILAVATRTTQRP